MTSQERIHRSGERETEPLPVLIVDDEEPIAELLVAFVTDLGYSALVARNGQQALKLARERWPSLVITDLMMPIMSGADLIMALRAEAEASGRASPRIVLLTAGSVRAVSHLQVDAMLPKPFDLGRLEQVMRRLLRT